MALENIPWAVLDGIVSASTARMLAHDATGGEEGVAGIGDMVVRQTAVASGNVRISAGGAIMLNRYPGAFEESYLARAGDETLLAISPNAGGSTRYDLVIVRVDDWNFPGQQATPGALPTNAVAAVKYAVISGVASSVKSTRELNLSYPAVALARIAVPAATSAITQAMITSVREKAVPRRKRDLRPVGQAIGRDNSLTSTATIGEYFPNDSAVTVEVPYWATRVQVQALLGGIVVPAGTAWGSHWVRIGQGRADLINTQATESDFTSPRVDPSRQVVSISDSVAIPSTMRGQSVTVVIIGRKLGGSVNLKADGKTSMSIDLEFLEAATEDV